MSRQPGDIDIWVEGGCESVTDLLMTLGLLDERPTVKNLGKANKASTSYHHVHLPPTKDGVTVEVSSVISLSEIFNLVEIRAFVLS